MHGQPSHLPLLLLAQMLQVRADVVEARRLAAKHGHVLHQVLKETGKNCTDGETERESGTNTSQGKKREDSRQHQTKLFF